MKIKKLAKTDLGFFPTPLHKLERLTRFLAGPNIYIKRDDQTGLATGGNKTRKLEYLVADALEKGCDTLITGGAAQSNHCRQTAAAAVSNGLSCHLSLRGLKPETINGNLLVDNLLGVNIHWEGPVRRSETMPNIAKELSRQGKKPYLIPIGGSNAVGSSGYVFAVAELMEQLKDMNLKMDHIIFASSSGGTHAGLTVGKDIFGLPSKLTGIRIDKDDPGDYPFPDHLADLCDDTAKLLQFDKSYSRADFDARDGYQGDGYGIVSQLEREAISLMAKKEGILLDPVYTGRAMGGLLNLLGKGEFSADKNILFWHTGGATALFNYVDDLL